MGRETVAKWDGGQKLGVSSLRDVNCCGTPNLLQVEYGKLEREES